MIYTLATCAALLLSNQFLHLKMPEPPQENMGLNTPLSEVDGIQKFSLNKEQAEILLASLPKHRRHRDALTELLTDAEAFKNHVYGTPMLAYRLAKANPDLYEACATDELHVMNGGNSFRKAGAVRVSEVLRRIDLNKHSLKALEADLDLHQI